MADILIRKVDETVKERLAEYAAKIGSSLEAYVRQLLSREAAALPQSSEDNVPFGTWAAAIFAEIDPEIREEFLSNLERIENEPADIKAFPDD